MPMEILLTFTFKVFHLLRNQGEDRVRGCRSFQLLGEPVCQRGFVKLIWIGKLRFSRLLIPARNPDVSECPADGRYMPKGPQGTLKEQYVFDYLQGLYESAAETLPDCPSNSVSNKRPRQYPYQRDSKDMNRANIRHLPPGTIKDYWRLMLAHDPTIRISSQLFAKSTLHG